MRVFLFLVSFLLSSSALAGSGQLPPREFKFCQGFIPYGMPLHTLKQSTPICRYAYVLEYSNRYKTPIWVSYLLRPEYTVGCLKREESFRIDRSLPKEYRSSPADYEGSGYDMGHLVNVADMSWDSLAQQETYIMTNIVPQLAGFNRGIWKKLEDQTRAWAQERKHNLIVYAGPVYKADKVATIGNNKVYVPDGFYKVIIDTVTREVMSFRFVHTPVSADLGLFLVTKQTLEYETGIKFPMPEGYTDSLSLWRYKLKSTRIARGILCSTH